MTSNPQQSALLSQLTLHQVRRRQGIPTLSVIAGGSVAAYNLWTHWLIKNNEQGITWSPASQRSMFLTWLLSVLKRYDLQQQALEIIANLMQKKPDELAFMLAHTSPYQFDLFWQELPLQPTTLAAQFYRGLLELSAQQQKFDPQQAIKMAHLFAKQPEPDHQEGFKIVTDLLTNNGVPGLLVLPSTLHPWAGQPRQSQPATSQLITTLTQVAEQAPTLPLGIVLAPDQVSHFLTTATESRAKAIFRAGVIELESPTAETIKQWLTTQGCRNETDIETAVTLSTQYGTTPEILTAIAFLTQPTESHASDPNLESFRSHAEHFLYQYLQARAETTGLFEVNARLEIAFGNQPMEVDFLAASAKLVVEIDGYYHFQSPDNYRRDRRKDFELQKQGFWVLRFLAEDVVSHLEEILETICQAVSCRQSTATQLDFAKA